jgi:tetratricopeptide (TPR) repeat protein
MHTSDVLGHADLLEQIAKTSTVIAAAPTNSALYLKRAELRRWHAEYEQALEDLSAAEKFSPGSLDIPLYRARILWDQGNATEALRCAEEVLQKSDGHAEALALRGRSRLKLGQHAAALEDFSEAIQKSPAPSPDLLLERARAQADLGDFAGAAAGLDEGTEKVGAIPSLQLPAIEYDRKAGRFDSALARVEQMTARYPVKEPSLALRAEILEQAERLAEARETFRKVLAGIENYPPHRRSLDLTKQLESRARAGLARIEPRFSSVSSPPPTSLNSPK